MAYPMATNRETMTPMTSYEPDTKTSQLFGRYKKAYETERDLKPQVREAAETAIRAGASNQELAALTGLTPEFFRKIAAAIGVDNRRKAPTVGAEAQARLAAKAASQSTEPVANPKHARADEPEAGGLAMPGKYTPDLTCLGDRERTIVALLADGKPVAEIASLLGVQKERIAQQRRNIRWQLGAATEPQWQAVLQASRDEA